ncbi:hypothetical protein [Vibrio sp. F74]|uniref:hypothetical protein n=1 Tax=Vibrio sp. F74 TaxID=700020 RepID=UPI0035F5D62D
MVNTANVSLSIRTTLKNAAFVILGGLGLVLLLLKVDFDFSDIEWEWNELDMDYLGDISIESSNMEGS